MGTIHNIRLDDGTDIAIGVAAGASIPTSKKITRIEGGTATFATAATVTAATGLNVIQGAVAVLNTSAAPGVGTTTLTCTWLAAGGTLTIYAWEPTSNANPTLIANAGATDKVAWVAWGY